MWKRDEAVRPPSTPAAASPLAASDLVPGSPPLPAQELRRQFERDRVQIGRSVIFKGELTGSEDLAIEGQIEGKIELRDHVLTIGPNGKINAQIFAKSVVVLGEVHGNITATEKVDIRDNGSVDGDITAPRVAIAEGAQFRGKVDMQRKPALPGVPAVPKAVAAPVATPSVATR
ncbi:MAG: polymer-forming cytoskeletal protein [Vicinamibacterales bacterium]